MTSDIEAAPEPPEEIEERFNSRRGVDNFDEIVGAWARRAAQFRSAQDHAEIDVAYGPTARQRFDLFRPSAGDGAPIALFVHGGYWQAFDKSYVSHLAQGLLERGIAVAMPSYDLCPDVSLPTIVEQIRRVTALLAARNSGPLIAIGHSAGAHLVAMAMQGGNIRRAVLLSGLFELEPFLRTQRGARLELPAEQAAAMSPQFLPTPPGSAHVMIGAEEASEFLRQSSALAEKWSMPCEIVPATNHFTILDLLTSGDGMAVKAALA